MFNRYIEQTGIITFWEERFRFEYTSQDKLYLLLVSDNDNGMSTNRIAVFSLFPQIKWDELLEMPGRIYSTFCVSHDRIIAFESQRNSFEVFSF